MMHDARGHAIAGEVVAAIHAAWAWANMLEVMPTAWNRGQLVDAVEDAWRRALDHLDEKVSE